MFKNIFLCVLKNNNLLLILIIYKNKKEMARHKIPDSEKRKDVTFSVNLVLNEKLEKYLEDNGYTNKSKYIEKLIKEDLKKRGEDIDDKF